MPGSTLFNFLTLGIWSALISAVVAYIQIRREYRLEYATEKTIKTLLKCPDYSKRSFSEIKKRLKGFDDDVLRQHLIRAGAVSFAKSDADGDDANELWGLLELNKDAFKGKRGAKANTD